VDPILYFWGIPYMIQYYINNPPKTNTFTIQPKFVINNLDVNSFTPKGFGLHLKATVEPVSAFPVSVGMGDLLLHIYDTQNNLLVDQFIPGLQFPVNKEFVIETSPQTSFENTNLPALQKMIKSFTNLINPNATATGFNLADLDITARFNLNPKLMGISIYQALPLYKHITGQDMLNMMAALKNAPPVNYTIPPQILVPTSQLGKVHY
jgi:hypothetical protein